MKTFLTLVALLGVVACNNHQKAPEDAPLAPAAGPAATPKAEAGHTLVSGTIRIDDALKDKLPASAILFIVARPAGEMASPVSVKRVDAVTFPVNFTLEADHLMMGGSVPDKLVVTARLDQDGDAISKSPGDLTGAAKEPVAPGATGVDVVLSEVIGTNL